MKTSRKMSMHRTGTMPVSLPKISKLNVKQSRYNGGIDRSSVHIGTSRGSFHISISHNKQNHSFLDSKSLFTNRVQQQVLVEQQYPYIETVKIQRQQCRLKDLLKEFNQQTVSILQKYIIQKPTKKQFVKKRMAVEQIYQIRDKESQNSQNMILLLKNEIEKLQSRCENLKYTSKEEFQCRIKELRQEKQRMVVENKELSREITLNGLEMVKGKESLVKELEYQLFLIDSRRDRLRKDSQRVTADSSLLQQKIKQTNVQADKYQQQDSFTLKQYQQLELEKTQGKLIEEYNKKKKLYQHFKVINHSTNYQFKHKYFQKLKEFDQTTTKEENNQNKAKQFEADIEKAKEIIKELQKKEAEMFYKPKAKSFITQPFENLPKTISAKINIEYA